MSEIKNARIEDVSITMANHGCLTFYLHLSGGGWGCCYGGYCIGKGYLGATDFTAYGKGLECIMRVMNTVGVERWEDLKGKYIRIVNAGLSKPISKIGHITNEEWFDIEEFFREDKE